MQILLNGENKIVPDSMTVRGLLEHLRIQHQRVAVELNESIVKKDGYDSTVIKEGDSLEVVSFMGGGSDFGLRISPCTRTNAFVNAGCGRIAE